MDIETVDSLEVKVLVDNLTDTLSSIPKTQASLGFKTEMQNLLDTGRLSEWSGRAPCCALHGLSLLVTAANNSTK